MYINETLDTKQFIVQMYCKVKENCDDPKGSREAMAIASLELIYGT